MKTPRKLGRPLLGLERKERYQIRLEPRIAARLRRYGGGNMSRAIAQLAEKVK